MPDLDPGLLKLSGPQRDLYDALSSIDGQLRDIYFGILAALQQDENPDRIAQAAHGARELMEKLPRKLDVPILADPPTLMEQVRSLAKEWQSTKARQNGEEISKWTELGQDLMAFLESLEKFLSNFEKERPSRTQQPALLIRRLDPSNRPLPVPIEKRRVQAWDRCHSFFEKVSHHRSEPSLGQFQEQLNILEQFLLDLFRPRTFSDRKVLDAIIEEGEGNAE